MEVRPGYKQTEVGVIPEDWEARPLGSVAPIATGNTPPTRDLANYGDEFLFVSPVDMGFTKHISSTEKMLSRKGFSISRAFPTGSVLFVCIGSTIGKCGIAPETLTSNQQINAILPSAGMSFDYLYYAVSAVAPKVKSLAGEQAVPIVNKSAFSDTAIPLPPTKAEQEAIAEALSDADALIESLEQLLAKKRQIKQGAMQELLRPRPSDAVRLLGEVSSLKGRIGWQGLKQAEFTTNDDEPFLITGMNFKDGAIRWSEVYHISEARYEMAPEIQLRPDDVLMTKDGTIGKVLYIDTIPYPGKASLNSHLLLFRPKAASYNPKYLYYQLGSQRFRDFVETGKSGTTFFGLSQAAVAAYPALLPPLTEQAAIAAILGDMDAEIGALEAKLTKARAVKQGMMQELLTGRIRLV